MGPLPFLGSLGLARYFRLDLLVCCGITEEFWFFYYCLAR